MKTELVDVSPTRKEIKIEIEAGEVRAEFERVSQRYAGAAKLDGFRKGHVPVSEVRRRFRDEIRGEVVQSLVPRAINEAILKHQLNVIGEPEIHLEPGEGLEQFGEKPLAVHAHVEVLPEVRLGEYKGLEVARRVRPVTDEIIDQWIEGLREQSASLLPVETRGAQEGDTVTVNFDGKYVEPPSDEPIKAENHDLVLGGEGVLPAFTENLTGVRPDDVKTFRVKYPGDYHVKGLAGKEVELTATVTGVHRKELPELDDEWARSLGEGIESIADLRARLREQLTARSRVESDHRLRDELLSRLTGAHQIDLPESLVEYQTQRLLESTVNDMMRRGIDPRSEELNWEGLQDILRAQAEEDLRGSLLLERIAEAEQIEPTAEEINQEIESIAAAVKQTPEQVRAALTKQGGERSIADRLRHRKTLDMLVASARISDEEWRDEESPQEAAARTGKTETQTSEAAAEVSDAVATQSSDAPAADDQPPAAASATAKTQASEDAAQAGAATGGEQS